MSGALGPEMPAGDGPELRVNQRQEPLQRAVIPLLPGPENLRDLFDDGMIQASPLPPTDGSWVNVAR
jgi:hypothetical protein